MKTSLTKNELIGYVTKQINTFYPDLIMLKKTGLRLGWIWHWNEWNIVFLVSN